MNIGIDIRPLMSPARSGVGEYTFELLNALFAIDKTNTYFLFYNSHQDVSRSIPQWQQNNIRYVHKKWPNKLFNASSKIFGFPKIDAVIYQQEKIHIDYFFSTNFSFTALSEKTKYILTVHDLSFEFFPQFYSWKQRLWHQAVSPKKQGRRADLILAPSENTKRDLVDFYKISQEKIRVMYPGVNTLSESPQRDKLGEENLATQRLKIKQKYNLPEKFILFLGTIEPRKNIPGLIEAFEKSYSLLPAPYSLVIAGHKGWNDKKIYQRFQSSPYKDKIKFIGSIGAEDKSTLYSLASLFVYPSFYEGFGFPVVEAMAAGTPVITSNRSSLPEITDRAAYLVDPNKPSKLAVAIVEMLTNGKLKEYFTKLGLEQVKKFSWERMAREFLTILR